MGIKMKKLYLPPLPEATDREVELQDKLNKLQNGTQEKEPEVTTSTVKKKRG